MDTKGKWCLGLSLAAALALGACTTVPQGPSVMVLPGPDKSLEQLKADDATCRPWAAEQAGTGGDSWMLQRRYDIAYQQCMYSRGHDLPGFSRSTGPAPGQRVPPPPPGAPPPPPPGPIIR